MSIQLVIEQLEALNEIHCGLLELAKLKQRVIVENNVEELTKIMNKESKLIKQVVLIESQRAALMPEPNMTVTELIKRVFNAEEKRSLAQAQRSLISTMEQLKEVNQLNQQLVQQSLAFIGYSLDLLIGSPEDDTIYHNPSQQSNGTSRAGLFDTKA